jgi:hypothetical protein
MAKHSFSEEETQQINAILADVSQGHTTRAIHKLRVRSSPELIFTIVEELATNGDDNSRWIAHRACRNLVKKEPERVLDVLDVDEYHYKDRHYHRRKTDSTVATNGTEEG